MSKMIYEDLGLLIKEMEDEDNRRGLSDEYLAEHHIETRKHWGIGEYHYGIVTVPVDWVLPYLKKYKAQTQRVEQLEKALRMCRDTAYQSTQDCPRCGFIDKVATEALEQKGGAE